MAKILLVEDDNNLREIYEARLQAEGYTIVSAMDGEEALVIAKEEKPDLVISDVMMPNISGFEMLDILRNTDDLKNVKVIMLTALGQAEDKTRADSLGADRYLVKSQVTLEDIVKAAQELLGPAGGSAVPAATAAPQASAAAPAAAIPEPAMPVPTPPMPATPPSAPSSPVPTPPTPVPAPTLPTPASPTPPAPSPVSTPPTPLAPPVEPAQPPAPATPSIPVEPPAPAPASAPPTSAPVAQPSEPTAAAPTSSMAPSPTLSPSTPTAPVIPEGPTPTSPDTGAQSASAEEEAIKAQIESFVTQNNQTAPGSKPAAEPPTSKEENKPAEKPATPEATDDTLMANAIKNLVTEDEEKSSQSPATPPANNDKTTMPAPAVVTPSPQPETPTPAANAAPEAKDESSEDDGVAVAHKKIISPISGANVSTQSDLNELLAKEGFTAEDIHAENQPNPQNPTGLPPAPHPPGHVISPNPAGDQGGVDPNSIAL